MEDYSNKISDLVKIYGGCECQYIFNGNTIYLVEYEPFNNQAKFWYKSNYIYGKNIPEEDLKNIFSNLIQNIKEKLEKNIERNKEELDNSINLLNKFNNTFNKKI